MRRIAFTALSLLTIAFAGYAQQPGLSERVDVNAVLIDAVVTDASGNQILGLTKDDFTIKENGVEQTIDSLDYFTTRRLVNAKEDAAPFNVEQVKEERYFIFFVDKFPDSSGFARMAAFRRAAGEFVKEEMRNGDLIAVVGHDVRLKVYTDFTNDKKQIEKALDEVQKMGKGVLEAPAGNGPSIIRNLDTKQMMDKTGTVYQALDMLADSVRPIRARKALVLVSPVIIEQGEDISNGMLMGESRYYQPMIDSLNASNVTVFAMNMYDNPPFAPAYHQTMEKIVAATNGEYYRFTQNFRQPMKDVAKNSAGYYLLTYRSNHPTSEKGFQKVDVAVKQPEFRVKARAGYSYGD